jgi:hypothetical protein
LTRPARRTRSSQYNYRAAAESRLTVAPLVLLYSRFYASPASLYYSHSLCDWPYGPSFPALAPPRSRPRYYFGLRPFIIPLPRLWHTQPGHISPADMSRTKELPLVPVSEPLLQHEQPLGSSTFGEPHTYTVTLSFSFGTAMGLGDTTAGVAVLRILSIVIAAGGFVVVSRPS